MDTGGDKEAWGSDSLVQAEQREAAEELRRIRSITVFQEIKSSTKEFGRLRDAIARGELTDYIKEKKNLKRAVNSVNPLKKLLTK